MLQFFRYSILTAVILLYSTQGVFAQVALPVSTAPLGQENLIFYVKDANYRAEIKMVRYFSTMPPIQETVLMTTQLINDIRSFKSIVTDLFNTPDVNLLWRETTSGADTLTIMRFNGDDPTAAQIIVHPLNLRTNTLIFDYESLAVAKDFNDHLFVLAIGVQDLSLMEFDTALNLVGTRTIVPAQFPAGLEISNVSMKFDPVTRQAHIAYIARGLIGTAQLNFLTYNLATSTVVAEEHIDSSVRYWDRLALFVESSNNQAMVAYSHEIGGPTLRRRSGQGQPWVLVFNSGSSALEKSYDLHSDFVSALQNNFFLAFFLLRPPASSLPDQLYLAYSQNGSFIAASRVATFPPGYSLNTMSFVDDPMLLSGTLPTVLSIFRNPTGGYEAYLHKPVNNRTGQYTTVLVDTLAGYPSWIYNVTAVDFPK